MSDDDVVDAELVGADPPGDELGDVTAERDSYLDRLQRLAAEFENFKKQSAKRASEATERANERLAEALLPVLDACDLAMAHHGDEIQPVFTALVGALSKEGLDRLEPAGDPFDPTHHDAVMHEAPAEGDEPGEWVVEVLRAGYTWKGRVLRPAMVKVRG